ncbi:hypothetical protein V493_01684 [Pseudogymnoascus sp. VKM F-4281 (FW-2241)]|nr:hypothetical protein V493_01684 [Pseudogymnoascus sp. VKM F-4281 (FW-2241)]
MEGTKQQNTIPTVHNISSSKAISPLWLLEELENTGITYKAVNLPRRSVGSYERLDSLPAQKVAYGDAGTCRR